MADETKRCCSCNIRSIVKMLVGILILFLGVLLTIKFFEVLKMVILGCFGPFLILVGLLTIAIAKE